MYVIMAKSHQVECCRKCKGTQCRTRTMFLKYAVEQMAGAGPIEFR
jgi:hypothetical protein